MVGHNYNSNYIYRTTDGKIVLHDFIYDMLFKFELSENKDVDDFAIQLVNKIADRIYIWQLYANEINSKTRDFFIGLYKYIEQNGGLKNCKKLSDYTYNINNINGTNELVRSGVIKREEVKINNQELICCDIEYNAHDSERLSVAVYNILRDSKGYLVLPDEIYKLYSCFDGDNAYKFAAFALQKMSDKVENITEDIYRYFAAIFKLIEEEKFCMTVSEFCKSNKIGTNKEYIKLMIDSGKARLYRISIDKNGSVSESPINNTSDIDNGVYNYANNSKYIDIREEEHKSYVNNKINNIVAELNKIDKSISIKDSGDYIEYRNKINNLKKITQNVYEYVKHKYELNEIHDCTVVSDTEKKYKELISFTEKLMVKIERIYFEINNKQKPFNNQEKIDYYEQIKSELEKFEAELDSITNKLVVNSDKDYMSLHSKLSNLRDRLHSFYDKSLKEAHENEGLTGRIIKEATTKHNELIKKIEEALKNLEVLKKKLLFKNIFNG